MWKSIISIFEKPFVQRYLTSLKNKGILPNNEYNLDQFNQLRGKIQKQFNCGRKTSIRPEEERLLYAISEIIKPQSVIGVGSYFGYAMAWLVAGMNPQGTAYLIDPDPKVSKLAQENFKNLGLSDRVEIINVDFFDIVDDLPKTDLVWIDAAGPRNSANPDYRHKKIYGPIIESLDQKVVESGLVLAHNVLPLSNKTGRFKPYLRQTYQTTCNILSGGGIYIAKK